MNDFRRVLRNAGWNVIGNATPLLAAAALLPMIVSRLGVERFGLLSMAWVLIGYFSFFDLGTGRALTKMIAERRGTPDETEIPGVASTGLALMALLGVTGAAIAAACIPFGFAWVSRLHSNLTLEARNSLFLVALGIPAVVLTSALRGILEGLEAFRTINLIRAPAGALIFGAPAVSAAFSDRLDFSILALVIARLIVLILHIPPSLSRIHIRARLINRAWIKPMFRFGGWLTISSIVGPLIVYVDRFVLATVLSAAAAAYYVAPFELVSRLLVLPAALAAAMFPTLSHLGKTDVDSARTMRSRATHIILSLTLPVVLLGVILAKPLLSIWLGPAFGKNSALALQLLLPGFALNSLAQIPLVALYGAGRTRPVAVMHLIELPLYSVALLLPLVHNYGITGAAAAWSLRAGVDWLILSTMLRRLAKKPTI
jgi:O-antigen/teichoic acid export membrane protein